MRSQPPDRFPSATNWPSSGGEAAERIASLEWANTSLGAMHSWPQSLRTAVDLCLSLTTPSALIWGPERLLIFNSGCARLCGAGDPWRMLGKPLGSREKNNAPRADDVWRQSQTSFERALKGESFTTRQRLFAFDDTGPVECFFSFAFTPTRDESGEVAGAFFNAQDATQQALTERRLRSLDEFTTATAAVDSFDTVHHWFPSGLSAHALDLPFALLYLLDRDASSAVLAGSTGLHDEELKPRVIPIDDDGPVNGEGEAGWPLALAVRRKQVVPVRDVLERFGAFACGPYPEPIREALLLPVELAVPRAPLAVLVLGVSPRRPLDDAYQSFFFLLRDAIRQVLTCASARAESRHWETTNAELVRSEERYRAMVEGQAEMICRFHPDGTIYFTNGAYARAVGSTTEALEGSSFWDYVAEDDKPAVRDLLTRLSPQNPEVHIENQLETSQGTRWTLWTNRTLVFDDQGKPIEVQSVGLDITDRKRVEQALGEREEQLRLALQGANAGAWSIDVKTRVTFWSREFLSLYGFEPDTKPRFREWIQRVHPDDRGWVEQAFISRPLADASEYQQEFRIIHPQRGERWLLALGRVERDSEGEARRISGINIDITERKTVERALRESEERFRTLADNMSQLAWMADPNGWVFWYNRRWYEYTGTSLEAMQGWGWTKVHRPETVDKTTAFARQMWKRGEPWEQTFEMRSRDGNYRWFLTRVTPIFRDGKLIRWFGTNTDITEQRAAEEALKEADRRKDEFLATLAHELRNPLAPLRNCLEVMRLASEKPEAVAESRAIMERQLAHMVHLINDLLDLSRISRGKVKLRKQTVTVDQVIDQAVESCRPLMEEAGHKLTTTLPQEPVYIDADPARMAQVFANLLSNAAKFTGEHGQIWLTVESTDGEVALRVRDNGIGISPKLLDQVFDMFTQGDPEEQAQGGLGIGLSLVKGLVEMHGGSVEARSEGDNRGSEFIVRLPALAGNVNDRSAGEKCAAGTPQRRRILVVDDNRDAASSMATMLELMDNETRSAHDGLEALEVAAAFRPHLVLLDLGMPRMNGYEAARRIRAEEWGRNMLLVALTGWGQAEDRRRSKEAGFDFHLVKPVDIDALRQLLEGESEQGVT